MDSITHYKDIIQNLIHQYANYKPSHGEITTEAVIDSQLKHYEVIHVGWDGERRVHGSIIHIDIIDDKVWIQHDGTSPGIVLELVEAGIPREAIVLGFHPAHIRRHTGFATV